MKIRTAVLVASGMGLLSALAGCLSQRCYEDLDCPRPQRCSPAGTCELECTVPQDCGPGFTCQDHVCTLEPPPAAACPEEMATLDTFCIDRYEASRSDATAHFAGTSTTATARAGVIPWYSITLGQARAACASMGKRLCRPDEWFEACTGPDHHVYAYGDTYDPTICNGIDAGLSIMPTGSLSGCTNAYGLYDANGNVWEIVDTNDGREHFRGGAFNCIDSALLHRCDYDATWNPSAKGFRCCIDRSPP